MTTFTATAVAVTFGIGATVTALLIAQWALRNE